MATKTSALTGVEPQAFWTSFETLISIVLVSGNDGDHELSPVAFAFAYEVAEDAAVAVVGGDVGVGDQAFCRTWTARLATRSLFFSP